MVNNMNKLLHICEVCKKTETLTPNEAFEQGWIYPPSHGDFKVIDPRTCGQCSIKNTLWWRLIIEKIDPNELNASDLDTLNRILSEPASMAIITLPQFSFEE